MGSGQSNSSRIQTQGDQSPLYVENTQYLADFQQKIDIIFNFFNLVNSTQTQQSNHKRSLMSSQTPKRTRTVESSPVRTAEGSKRNKKIQQSENRQDIIQTRQYCLDLRQQLTTLQLPICSKGQQHGKLEFICVDQNCQVEDQLKLLCKRCVKEIIKSEQKPSHITQPITELLSNLISQIEIIPHKKIEIKPKQNHEQLFPSLIESFRNLSEKILAIADNLDKNFLIFQKNQQINSQIQVNFVKNYQKNQQDSQEIQKIIQNLLQNNSEQNFMKSFNHMKNFVIVGGDKGQQVEVLDIWKDICQIKKKIIHFYEILKNMISQENLIEPLNSLNLLREKEKQNKILQIKKNRLNQEKMIMEQQRQAEVERKRVKQQEMLERKRQEQLLHEQMLIEQEQIRIQNERNRQIAEQKRIEWERQEKIRQEQERLRKIERDRLAEIQRQKNKLISERNYILDDMEDHTRYCDNPWCKEVQWGLETEYKYIGILETKDTEGRKKTNCPKGKDLNYAMKEVIRRLKLIGE